MSYVLLKDCKVMCRGPVGAEWQSVLAPVKHPELPLMTWPTREGATMAAEMQGAAVVPVNQIRLRR